MKGRIFLAFALVTAWPLSAASGQTSTWELNLNGGVLRHDVFDESDTDLTVGGKLARYTRGGWGFGAKLDYIGAGERTLGTTLVDVRLLRYAAEVDKSFPSRGRTRMTVGSGVGAAMASYDGLPGGGDERETNLMVPILAGLKFMNREVAPSWGFSLMARDQMVFLDDTDVVGASRDSRIVHDIQGTAGLSFFFGGGDRKPRSDRAPVTMPTARDEIADIDREREARERALAEIREKIFFDFDRYEIKTDGRQTLQRKAEALRAHPDIWIVIEGHADERGTVEYNLALGEKRARAALDYLVDLGVDPVRMSAISYGEERPSLEGTGEAIWSQNRRDEFVPSEGTTAGQRSGASREPARPVRAGPP
jgi:peptidoglycan-associated lipoprotein